MSWRPSCSYLRPGSGILLFSTTSVHLAPSPWCISTFSASGWCHKLEGTKAGGFCACSMVLSLPLVQNEVQVNRDFNRSHLFRSHPISSPGWPPFMQCHPTSMALGPAPQPPCLRAEELRWNEASSIDWSSPADFQVV